MRNKYYMKNREKILERAKEYYKNKKKIYITKREKIDRNINEIIVTFD